MRKIRPQSAEHVVQSRFLIMQSKRLLLLSAERRATLHGTERLRERLQRLRSESDVAADAYRRTVLELGSPSRPDYWPVAYSEMIHLANRLSVKLRHTADTMPASERRQIAVDVKLIEQLIKGWTESMRGRIAAA